MVLDKLLIFFAGLSKHGNYENLSLILFFSIVTFFFINHRIMQGWDEIRGAFRYEVIYSMALISNHSQLRQQPFFQSLAIIPR